MISLEESVLKVPSKPGEKPTLIASKCNQCGRVFFPKRMTCAACSTPDVKLIDLSQTGKVVDFAVVDRKPKFALIDPPFTLALIEMPEKCQLYGVIRGISAADLRAGDEVELDIEKVKQDEKGNDVMAYIFKPAAKGK
jgi:uncharacterized protein